MTGTMTVGIPHLGGSAIGYKIGAPYDPTRPTVVMINSFTTSVELYRAQHADTELADAVNLLAIEPYGHGATRATWKHFTYWDSAIANLQVLETFGIRKAFVLGTSQGGWIAARMAMLAPDTVEGIVVLGTSMDDESQRSRDLGCWDGEAFCTPTIDEFSRSVGDDWVVPDDFVAKLLDSGLGDTVTPDEHAFWLRTYRANYTGDAGRSRILVSAVNLRDRDGLHARLADVRCPVLWLHGTDDSVYSIANAREEIAMFTNSPSAELRVIDGGQHFLSASHPVDVDRAAIDFISRTINPERKPAMTHTQKIVAVRDTHLFVDDTGEQDLPVILCLHSLFLDSRMFDGLVDAVRGRFRVVRPEFRGQGRSDFHDVEIITMDDDAEDILALIDLMGLKDIHMVAQSMGGDVGVRVAARRPYLFRRIAMAGSICPRRNARGVRRVDRAGERRRVRRRRAVRDGRRDVRDDDPERPGAGRRRRDVDRSDQRTAAAPTAGDARGDDPEERSGPAPAHRLPGADLLRRRGSRPSAGVGPGGRRRSAQRRIRRPQQGRPQPDAGGTGDRLPADRRVLPLLSPHITQRDRDEPMRLQNKVVLVTGAASGIGAAVADVFTREGAVVIAADINEPHDPYPTGVTSISLDVTKEDEWATVVDEILASQGRLDVLINNAGHHRLRAAARTGHRGTG